MTFLKHISIFSILVSLTNAIPTESSLMMSWTAGAGEIQSSNETIHYELNAVDTHVKASTAYRIVDEHHAGNWFSKYNVKAISDPTRGFVTYLDESSARRKNLYRVDNNRVYIGVDSSSVLNPNGAGRDSVRIESKSTYTRGLFIASFAHIPGSNCGSWPAYWMYGDRWPANGEIDIIEGVNNNVYNTMSLHTAPGCSPRTGSEGQTGRYNNEGEDCGRNSGHDGCGINTNSGSNYGTSFSAAGGGYYAMLWTSSGIKIWYFSKGGAPADISSGSPNPSGWGRPLANFGPGCEYDRFFRNHVMVFDITFCGDWAGAVWPRSSCANGNGGIKCNEYVANQPQAFGDSYWLIDWVRIFGT